tara:strand:- start:421 stop:849 length:429 start_codon:yes stop_codon:yes gene_type:complete
MRLTKIQKEIMLANHTEMCEKLDRQEEAKTKKNVKARDLRELETIVGKAHVGSFEIDNELNIRADIYLDSDKWEVTATVEYRLNGRKRTIKVRADANDMVSSGVMTEVVRGHVLEDLSKFITLESMEQNKKTISAVTREFRA